jgi:predicted dehydrogenase
VKKVAGMTRVTFPTRTITSQPQHGKVVTVETPTHLTGVMEFANGALATVIMSFDVAAAELPLLQVIGTRGTMIVPDPNGFGGKIRFRPRGGEWGEVQSLFGYQDNSRGLGVADLASAIRTNRPARASGDLAFHVLDVMQAFLDAGATGKTIEMTSTCERPALLPLGLRDGQVD